MKKKTFWKISLYTLMAIIAIHVVYITYRLGSTGYTKAQLTTKEGVSSFYISSIININEDRITKQTTTYYKRKFIQYDCIIDSVYCINIVKVGKLKSNNIEDCIHFSKSLFPLRLLSPLAMPFPFKNTAITYNAQLFSSNQVEQINIYVKGLLVAQDEYDNNQIVSCLLQADYTAFSFNDYNKNDLAIAIFYSPFIRLVFYTDTEQNLYIIHISTLNGTEPPLFSEFGVEAPDSTPHLK